MEMADAVGKSAGKFNGHKYFHCKAKHAVLMCGARVLRHQNVRACVLFNAWIMDGVRSYAY